MKSKRSLAILGWISSEFAAFCARAGPMEGLFFMPKVALIMGSKSDAPSLAGCVKILRAFGVEVEVHVASAHRTPEKVAAFADHARENGFEVIIAAAGKAAHLAGVIAGHTTLPVIGIPVKSSLMDGLDSLLSTVPSGPAAPSSMYLPE